MDTASLLKKPILTEKSLRLAQSGQFTFEVVKKAKKKDIAREVEKQFNVNVVSVATITTSGKKRRVGKLRKVILKPSKKKAIVKLKKDEKIPLFEV